MRQLINKFRETGSVADTPKSGRATILTEDKVLDTSDRVMESPKNSVRKLSQHMVISYG